MTERGGHAQTAVAGAGLVLVCLAAILAAGLQVLLVPLRAGTALAPVSVPFALITNVGLPRLGYALAGRTAALVAPFVCWLVPFVLLALTARPEGDVLVPGGGGVQWVFYATLLVGGLAGMITVARAAAPQRTYPR